MQLSPTSLPGMYEIQRSIFKDERGIFSRLYDHEIISQLNTDITAFHINTSTSRQAGTFRGVHFQYPPFAEDKIVSCVSGKAYDIGVDLRPGSPTRFQYFASELTPTNGHSLLIPKGFGHAFLTLEPDTTLVYIVSSRYEISCESGLRYDDPLVNLVLPIPVEVLSSKDSSWPLLADQLHELDKRFEYFK